MHRLMSLISEEDGTELVEFAVVSTVFFAFLFGIIGFSLAMYSANFVAIAAQQGTRYAMVRGSDWTGSCASVSSYGCQATTANVQNYILAKAPGGLNLSASNITVTWLTKAADGSSCKQYSQGCQVEVAVSIPFQLHIPLLNTSIPFSSTSIETIQN
jgi:Flp pilus assembly protein TadG